MARTGERSGGRGRARKRKAARRPKAAKRPPAPKPTKAAKPTTAVARASARKATARAAATAASSVFMDTIREVVVVPGVSSRPRARALRRDDFLALVFEFVNLKVVKTPAPAKLVRVTAGQPAYIIVHFPPQNIAEQAFFEAATGAQAIAVKNNPDASVGARGRARKRKAARRPTPTRTRAAAMR